MFEVMTFSITYSAEYSEAVEKFRLLRDLAEKEGLICPFEEDALRALFSLGPQYVYNWKFKGETLKSFIGFLSAVSELDV